MHFGLTSFSRDLEECLSGTKTQFGELRPETLFNEDSQFFPW